METNNDWKTIVADFESRHRKGQKAGTWQDAADYVRQLFGDGSQVPAQAEESGKVGKKMPTKTATEAQAEMPGAMGGALLGSTALTTTEASQS